jgi:hypothetical protein
VQTTAAAERIGPAAAHLAPLPGGPWQVWRWLCLRGAGFPAADLLELAAPESSRLADVLIEAEARARESAVASLREALAVVGKEGPGRKRLQRSLRRLRPEGSPAGSPTGGDDSEGGEVGGLRAQLTRVFAAEQLEVSARLRDLAAAPAFREAVLWQNRHAYWTGLDPLLKKAPGEAVRRKDSAAKELLVASYLQRYCAKNDTIGFFGPSVWGRIVDGEAALRLATGPALVAKREVSFEGWCIDALARKLTESQVSRPWIAPRLRPHLSVDGRWLRIPGQQPVELSPEHARLLDCCDGEQPAQAIAQRLVADPSVRFGSVAEVYELLELSLRIGLLTWTLEGPLEVHPERRLRKRLEAVGDEAVRAASLGALQELEDGRSAVEAAAGDASALDQALGALEATFSRLTGACATRRPGEVYAARTLVYEDCRRDVTLGIGPGFLSRLGPPLSLVLAAARWGTCRIAHRYREQLEGTYRDLAQPGQPAVDLGSLLLRIPAFAGADEGHSALLDEVHGEVRRRWAEALGLPRAGREVTYSSDALGPRVAAAFGDPDRGWRWPRYVSPDVMIAAPSVESIEGGDYQIVIGEVHTVNTLLQSLFTTQHPEPEELVRALDGDHPEPGVTLVVGKGDSTQRSIIDTVSAKDFRYQASAEGPPGEPARTLRLGELVVEPADRGLEVRTRDRRARFEILDFFGHMLTYATALKFNPMSLALENGHGPRITVDQVVLWRERWEFAPQGLEFAWRQDPLERFLLARRWARAQGLPRFLFLKVGIEPKPCYVDLDAPLYVDLLSKMVRKAAAGGGPDCVVRLSEMLPRLDQAWLVDARGRHYTSELRIAALDAAGDEGRRS